jgi:uncharacterized protein
MALRTDTFDLRRLELSSGEGRRFDLHAAIEPLHLGGEQYTVTPELVPVRLDVSRMTGSGYAMRLRFEVVLEGPCMRCLQDATVGFEVEARDVSQPGAGEELDSPYVSDEVLDLAAWARDALALTLPAQLLCTPDCPGLCPVCGVELAGAGPDHAHAQSPDPRWAKLSELRFSE